MVQLQDRKLVVSLLVWSQQQQQQQQRSEATKGCEPLKKSTTFNVFLFSMSFMRHELAVMCHFQLFSSFENSQCSTRL